MAALTTVSCSSTKFHVTGQYKVMMVNTPVLISEVGNQLVTRNPEIDFAAMYFDQPGLKRVWSLRAAGKADVSLIATSFGGGGHPNAAGFTSAPDFVLRSVP
jgi:oligoribonuclease NrnB/cAMP/cGMP phosphodiesterase (DHH superfamily)